MIAGCSKRRCRLNPLGLSLALCGACGAPEPPAAQQGAGGQAGASGHPSAHGGNAMLADAGNAAGGAVTNGGNASAAGKASGAGGNGGDSAGSGGDSAGGGKLEPWLPSFESRALSTKFVAEGASIGDIDGDGNVDVWAGPHWYGGPSFAAAHDVYAEQVYPIEQYSAHFVSFLDDLDGDQDLDGIVYGFPGEDVRWYENPGKGVTSAWPMHALVATGVGNESPTYADLVGDAKKELVFMSGPALGYAVRGATAAAWTFKPVSPALGFDRFTHGLGVGDLNGDGLNDIVERGGVWLQQLAPAGQDPSFVRQEFDFALGGEGGAQMLIYDVDGDDDADVVTSLNAHGYGLAWFEQTTNGSQLSFVEHEILPKQPGPGNFSQLHALALADLNGDGLADVVTGKRYYAHTPPADPGGLEPAVLYWFELSRSGGVKFTPHAIDDDSGVGTYFEIADLNSDQKPDIAITNKKGTFVHLQK